MFESFNLFNLKEPHDFYKWARKNKPIFFDKSSGYWIITKYNDIKNIISDESSFSAELERVNFSDFPQDVVSVLCPINFEKLYGLSTTENPQHDRVKRVVLPIFNDLFLNSLKPQIEKIIDEKLEKLKLKSEFDIAKELFYDLPAEIIFVVLGIPKFDVENIKAWSYSRMALTWGDGENQMEHAFNIVKYWNYCQELIQKKIKFPENDLPSKLLDSYKSNDISLHEIQLLCYGLIFSGHATTSSFLTESLKELLITQRWKEIIENDMAFSETVDELLRLCPSAYTRRRLALQDMNIGNHQIRKGDKLLLILGSGNRDEDIFSNADDLLLNRHNSNKHLSFGNGFHYCIGAKLVKLEYSIVMKKLATVFPNIRISPNNNFEYDSNISIRALKSLNVLT